jgi:hypothetical protein
MVIYDDTSNEPIRIFDAGAELPAPETFGEFRLTYRTGDIVSPKIDAMEPLALEIDDFCAAILDDREPRSSPRLGYEVVRSVEAIERSLKSGGHPCSTNDELDAGADDATLAGDVLSRVRPEDAGRSSGHDRSGRDVASHNGSGSDDRVLTDGEAAEHDRA